MNLLSVDWDYFFPNPLHSSTLYREDPAALLYDWGHKEAPLFINGMWIARAVGFAMNDLPLPQCKGYEGFWQRFNLAEDATLYVADSHSEAGNLLFDGQPWEHIYNYDAHHDCGYHRERPEDVPSWTHFDCEKWMVIHAYLGSRLHVRYPAWMTDPISVEKRPAFRVDRRLDKTAPSMKFHAAFLCRSGAWVPTWCDGQFEEFIRMFPGNVEEIELEPREWDPSVVEQQVTFFKEQRRQ